MTCNMSCDIFLHCSQSYANRTYEFVAVEPWLCFLEVVENWDSSSTVIFVSNMFVMCGLDKGRVGMISSFETLQKSLYCNMLLRIMIIYFLHQYFHLYYHAYMKWIKLFLKDYWWHQVVASLFTKFVFSANSVGHG